MVLVYTSIILVLGLWFFSDFFGQVWTDIQDYETMRSKGYKLMKNDKGEDMWVR